VTSHASPSRTDSPGWAIVTGASSGIGQCVAKRLALQGRPTVLIARRLDRLTELAKTCGAAAPSIAMSADLADPESVARVVADLAARSDEIHRIDVLINNAGYGAYRRFIDLTDEDRRRLMQVNYHAPAKLIHALLPAMVQQQFGRVINVSSVATFMGPWGHGPYVAAKSAIIGLTQTLAAEHSGSGVTFSYVLPGLVETRFFDRSSEYQAMFDRHRRHAVTPDYVARRIVALIDRPRLCVVAPRVNLFLRVLAGVSPSLAHRLVRRMSTPAELGDAAEDTTGNKPESSVSEPA